MDALVHAAQRGLDTDCAWRVTVEGEPVRLFAKRYEVRDEHDADRPQPSSRPSPTPSAALKRKLERFLSPAEANTLFRLLEGMVSAGEVDAAFTDMIRLLLLTGARKSEIQALQWSEIDFERRLIRLSRERSKTGEKTIPLNRQALSILSARKNSLAKAKVRGEAAGARSLHVFPSRTGISYMVGLQKAWERVRTRSNLSDVRIHDLRHSFASFAAANGASLFLIGKALGHSQAQTTERYTHLRDDPLHALAAGVGEVIDAD